MALSVWYEEYGFTSGVTSLLTSGVCFVVTFILLFVFYVRLATEKKKTTNLSSEEMVLFCKQAS